MTQAKLTEGQYQYHFQFRNGPTIKFHFEVFPSTGEITFHQPQRPGEEPAWSDLDYKKCSHCPLNEAEHPRCPVAHNLAPVVEIFKETFSYQEADVTVHSSNRSYQKLQTDIQTGLFSLFGLIMAVSNCPHLSFFRPLANYHLPFSDTEETLFRITSSFLLQKTIHRPQDSFVLQEVLADLQEQYKKVEMVNEGLLERLRSFYHKDAHANALVNLNIFAQFFGIEYDSDLSQLRSVFKENK